jgi:hypothetical protein
MESASTRRWSRRWRSTPTSPIAWVGALVADLVINKPLGLRPQHIEFKRAHLYDINRSASVP